MTAGTQLNRLRWRCRRGSLELDLILADFMNRCYSSLSAQERAGFEELLEQPDQSLGDWFSGKVEPPDNLRCIIRKII
ncbi:MAG: FAD assembly factor SdhE [Acidiferrobacterales bacterium]